MEKKFIKPPYQLDIVFSDIISLINKLENVNVNDKLSDYYNCENACATSDCYKLKDVLKTLKHEDEYDTNKYYKVINTGTIAPYVCKRGRQEMTYLKDKYLLPVVRIKQFESIFKNTYASKTKQKKIIIKGLTHLDGCIDSIGNVIPGKTTLIITAKDDDELKLICAYINSKVAFFYIKEKYSSYSYNGGINFQYKMINDLPWVNLSSEDRNKVLKYVDYIISHQEKDNKDIIDAIDSIYYNYFDLSVEEKKIINSSK